MEGEVVLDAVINEHGVVDTNRVHMVRSTHTMFSMSIKRSLSGWRFTPPMVDSQSVPVMARVEVRFVLPTSFSVPLEEVAAASTDSAGVHVSVGLRSLPPETGITLSRDDSIAASIAVSLILTGATPPRNGARCLEWGGKKVSDAVLETIRAKAPGLLNADVCPPTYTSMILRLDSKGNPILPPPGAFDPVWISVNHVRPWTRDVIVAETAIAQGTSGTDYFCEARRAPTGRDWVATCRRTRTWVS